MQTFSTSGGLFEKGELLILVDEDSASASEVVAGAVQDNDRGLIIGRRTFGKGLVQQQMPLGQGDQVRLTTARYYTPTGRSIQRPYDTSSRTDYYAEVRKRHQTGEMNDPSKIPINDFKIFFIHSFNRTNYFIRSNSKVLFIYEINDKGWIKYN